MNKIKTHNLLLITCLVVNLLAVQPLRAELEDNDGYSDAFTAWAGAHLTLLPVSFLPGPFGMAADITSIGIDIRLKYLPAKLIAPTPHAVTPNSDDDCDFSFSLPQKESDYENLLGIADIKSLATNWGAFSNPAPPFVKHANAQVVVRVDNLYLDDWSTSDKIVVFPSGNHPINWSANTQLDPLLDVVVPLALFIITNEVKYFKSFFEVQTDPNTAARAAEIGLLFLINAGIEVGVITAGQIQTNIPVDSAVHAQTRSFTVLDIKPPTITTSDMFPMALEATSFGGERWAQHKDMYRDTITAIDPCNKPLLIGNDAPFLLPLGTTHVTWEAIDSGPLGPNNSGRATVVQTITVEDTKAPIILVPPSRVIESNTAATTDDFDIGTAVVFDLADPNPVIDNSIGASNFLPNTRTQVVWTATDSSGNSANNYQWITIKTPGTNTAPHVNNVSANGLTSEHIDIELTGSDSDLLSGVFDPLKFKITTQPDNGFFVSPLVPYFIEDYRVRPGDVAGDILNTSEHPKIDLYNAFCTAQPPQPIPVDFVYKAQFVHVTDDGISYVLDKYWKCEVSGLEGRLYNRISKWGANGQLLAQFDINSFVQRITLDEDGFIYLIIPGTFSDELKMSKYDDNFNLIQQWKLDDNTGFGSIRLLGATLDANTGLIYATDKKRVYVYNGADGNSRPEFLGTLKNGDSFLSSAPDAAGSSNRGFYIEIDSTGALYIVDSGFDRIHKFQPSTFDGTNFVAGGHIGWMGRCDSGAGCDNDKGVSFGYSCSDATPCVIPNNLTFGSALGQFDTPIGIALDPNDILYVTDYFNSRVQRFSPLGDFAGVATSECDGSCFILGDMGMPLDISVNSTNFYVLDNDRALMHVFETAPFKEITDNSVIVTYASDNDFQGTDTFSFNANDGLVNSNQATATISISRNFRAPVTLDSYVNAIEDGIHDFSVLASDPDGIFGIDFNGLETLNYEIIGQTLYGQLTGSNGNYTYIPNANFNGTDSFTFRVNDGMFNSNTSTVLLFVAPVNDNPQVQFIDENSKIMPKVLWPLLKGKIVGNNTQAGLGYPLPLMAEFTDPDIGQSHILDVSWGDGSSDQSDQNPPNDPNNPSNKPIITKTFNGLGQIIGNHTYLSAGIKSVSINVLDDAGASNSAIALIEVIPMVEITLENQHVEDENLSEPGALTTMTIEVSNQSPADPIVGLTATNVEFTGELPVDVQFISIHTTQGSCTQFDLTSTCNIGTMQPSDVVTLTVTMIPNINFNPMKFGYIVNATSSEPDASMDNLAVMEIPVKFNEHIFSNGFE